ncbi:TetR/AcrR family transcriptional regulator C-terminal domain-containing protein [Lysinibacillus irui]|uniref:TetR/AcrR family transcriptional regulator C-terminal domain-containing protein n=3 Tax=Lysinibacillus TaxID=400634 RepID=A0AAJ5UXD6_9BACI|nr:TetR/AcrR family transcriptional regulator C-terminal domain-containing protein [Lysinibacillus irui]MEA0552026.1 TetR/AcrR family transcriptional regulator C-terminal domain-containing protein [Lysinibacillus irui]MEA0977951.1 TetR/AcrR family transcriptional regulator C-terminal domain-containing protein [Lysinibacillus irui]MEA1044105.1 TetR/AcrR family transcriptional regulator C-terminal domain-containing protein [Lysinibacillus irui]WDV08065.1 TetR/AcrR family transcriptional regulator
MSVHEKMNFETKQAIKKALILQVEEVGFERVTVKKLALAAQINRGTFYLHYADKYAVMEDLQQELLVELERYVKHVQPVDAFQTLKMGQLYQPFINVIACIKEHAPAFRMLLGEQGSPGFTQKMKTIFGNHILDRLSVIREEVQDPEFQQYLQAFIASAILGVIQEWLDKGNENLTVDEMVSLHFRLLRFLGNVVANTKG